MVDVENYIYTQVRSAIKLAHSTADVSSVKALVVSQFPHVSIVEADNSVVPERISTSNREFASDLMYEVNIYTNTESAKSDARAIAATVDTAFAGFGFRRSVLQPVPNSDRTVYRLVMRFVGRIAPGFTGESDKYIVSAR